MIRLARHLLRMSRIGWTFARYGALDIAADLGPGPALLVRALRPLRRRDLAPRPGQRLAAACTELGPSFIKFGQALSCRADLLGDDTAADLSALRDRLPPFPVGEVYRVIEAEFGRPAKDLFATFDETPIAAASIAQVHFATTAADPSASGVPAPDSITSDLFQSVIGPVDPPMPAGTQVAIKVLRPGVEQSLARDLDLFAWLAGLLERFFPTVRRLKPIEVVDTFRESVVLEMDLRFEAAAASELRQNFKMHETASDRGSSSALAAGRFKVPAIDWQRTARRVMTQERIVGTPFGDRDALIAAGHDLDAILATAAEAMFVQVFRDGFFHADMHPGNFFVEPDGTLVAVDFGIMGRLDESTRLFLAEMLIGFLTGDYRRVAEVHFRAGYVPAHKSVDTFTQACRSIGEPILGRPLHDISVGRLLAQLLRVADTFEMETQPQLLLLQKTMVLAEGGGRILNPNVNMWQLSQPLIEQWVRDNLGPQARLQRGARDTLAALERFPALLTDLEQATARLAEGEVKLSDRAARTLGEASGRGTALPIWLVVILLASILGVLLLGQ
ncbi:MAG: AarF/UbiB family protein [Pseudomonadota bacterium]